MTAGAPRHHYTFDDYMRVEEVSTVKHEFFDGEIYAMAGGTPEHAALSAALIALLGTGLRNETFRAYTSDLRLRVRKTGLATYPDVAVICGEPARDPESPTHVLNPIALFEVLSPGTEDYDRGEKREHYQQIESLQEYVVVAQDRRQIEIWRRSDDGAFHHEVLGDGDVLRLVSLDLSFPVDALYAAAGVRLD